MPNQARQTILAISGILTISQASITCSPIISQALCKDAIDDIRSISAKSETKAKTYNRKLIVNALSVLSVLLFAVVLVLATFLFMFFSP